MFEFFNKMYMKKLVVIFFIGMVLCSCSKEKVRNVKELISFKNKYKFDFEILEKLENDTIAWKYQLSANEFMLKGNYLKALKEWDKAFKGREVLYSPRKADSLRSNFTVHNAKDEIINESENTRLVIINEGHHNSYHRLFTKSLLEELYAKGYKHLGLEALANGKDKDLMLNTRGYPIKTSGYYTNDPNFSQLIRTAIKIGYNVFPYEQTIGVNNKEREIEQAKNIQKELEKFPNDKFLIHCGFDHVLEGSHRRWGKSMAGRLKEYTGINPLTIHQTKYSERGDKKLNSPLLKVFNVKKPSVLKDKNGSFFKYKRSNAWADIAVFHSSIKTDKGMIVEKDEVMYTLELERLKVEYPLMILVFETKDDLTKAVPVQIKEVHKKQNSTVLSLPKGEYSFVIVSKTNKTITFQEEIK